MKRQIFAIALLFCALLPQCHAQNKKVDTGNTETFVYEGKTYTPKSFAESLGLNLDDYVSLTSYTHHPFNQWFVIESPYKWRLKPSYNIPIEQLMDVLDQTLDAGYTVAWGGDVSGDFYRNQSLAYLPDGVTPTQEMRQEQWNDWEFTYDHVMLIYGKAVDEQGKQASNQATKLTASPGKCSFSLHG